MTHLGAHDGHLVTDSGHLATCEEFNCGDDCVSTLYATISTTCTAETGFDWSGDYEWTHDSGCDWTQETGAGPAEPVYWDDTDEIWKVSVPSADYARCDYEKSGVKSDCPPGDYQKVYSGCSDCDDIVTIDT